MTEPLVLPFSELDLSSLPRVGGKNASLGELIREVSRLGVRVPDGFAITAKAYRRHLTENDLESRIYPLLDALNPTQISDLTRVGTEVRRLIRNAPLPDAVQAAALEAYATLSRNYDQDATDVAVRSSATAEDLPTASFAGQQESYLNVHGPDALLRAVKDCMASLFTDRAIVYRSERGFNHSEVALSVGVQKMVRSDRGSAGVIFTLDTESGFRDVTLVTAAWGLGETVVQGRVNPDEYWVHKPLLERGFRPLLRRELGDKQVKLIYAEGSNHSVEEVRTSAAERESFSLSNNEVLKLAGWATEIEKHYSSRAGRPTPMDIEWGKDGDTGELFILQARPETVHSQRSGLVLENFRLREKGTILATGKSVGSKIGCGRVRVIHSAADLNTFREGDVLVAEMTDPDWEPVLKRAAAVVTDHGGRTCHAAIVSRELGVPCVVGCGDATEKLHAAGEVTVSCAEGDEGKIYRGQLSFDRETLDAGSLPSPRVPVMLNVGNPETAFALGQLPSAGVGLMRLEFVISSWIGIHPMALLQPDQVDDPRALAEIRRRTRGYESGKRFFVERLASGIATIAGAFHPRPVIVRFSDFKSNEYAGLIGGAGFEPTEGNPMIGFRGASRYYDERYRQAFALECEAVRLVREEMGLENVKVMIPFCRTIEEGRKVVYEMEKNGLRRGELGLEIYVMCEIPNNVILADQFSEVFDGFSIGSNDLTQLTLGVDRDSELLAHVFDEQDPGVKRMIEMVIERAHAHGRKVGLCGQGPSDHPEFARFLADAGIDSISVTGDALAKVTQVLAPDKD